ncbi:galactose mutarotase [Lactovum odontotermitis]
MKFTISETQLPFNTERSIQQITLSNGRLTIVVHDFGARLHQLFAPDRNGNFENILLSKNDSESYIYDNGYYGAICGPVAGRIAGAAYDSIRLEANEGQNLLHSGSQGWERQFWSYETFQTEQSVGITLTLTDKISGFPGPIEASVTYELVDDRLSVEMTGLSATDSLFNPALHPYFNLSADHETTLNHEIQVSANRVAETNDENIPTGRLLPVDGSVYDLQKSIKISKILEEKADGFDDCFVFPEDSEENELILYEPKSGRKLIGRTDRKSVVIYTATNPETKSLVNDRKMSANRGIAIEFQELPDSVHHPDWPSTRILAGEKKKFRSDYRFTVE